MEAVFTFCTTHAVITAEGVLRAAGLPAEVAGLPAAVSAGCGLCLQVPQGALQRAVCVLHAQAIAVQGVYISQDGTYHRLEEEGEKTHAEDENGTAAGV